MLFAIFFAVLNTMIMAGRERTRDIGIMKALGFTDGTIFRLLVAESLLLCGLGGGLGIALGGLAARAADPARDRRPSCSRSSPSTARTRCCSAGRLALGSGSFAGLVPGVARAARLPSLQPCFGRSD